MSNPLQTISFSTKNISSRVSLGSHTATINGHITIDVVMFALNAAAATITLDIEVERSLSTYGGDRFSRSKRSPTSALEIMPPLVQSVKVGDQVEIFATSTNSSDTAVSGEILIRDATAANILEIESDTTVPKLLTGAATARTDTINDDTYTDPQTDTSFVVTNGSKFRPGDYIVQQGSGEVMRVTGVSTNTLTVERGALGTTAEDLADGDILTILNSQPKVDADGLVTADTTKISGSATAADNLETSALAYTAARGLAGTALPDAAADAAGGLPISDAGGLDIDAKLANTNEVTAARMGALTDWIDGGRLDLLIDAIKAKTDGLTVASGRVDANITAVSGATTIDTLSLTSFLETVLAFVAGETTVTDLGGGSKRIIMKKQNGSTEKLRIDFNSSGEWTATTVS